MASYFVIFKTLTVNEDGHPVSEKIRTGIAKVNNKKYLTADIENSAFEYAIQQTLDRRCVNEVFHGILYRHEL